MTLALAFAIIMLVWLVFGFLNMRGPTSHPSWPVANSILIFVLFALLGWQVFGPLLHR